MYFAMTGQFDQNEGRVNNELGTFRALFRALGRASGRKAEPKSMISER
jgi:hypothetical protein